MKLQRLFLLLLLSSYYSLHGDNPPCKADELAIVNLEGSTCNLPPPSYLHVDQIGADWVNVSWPLVSGATQYRLQAFDAVSGDGLGTAIYVSGGTTSATVSIAGNNGSAFVRIWSVCGDGGYNVDNFKQSDTFDGIIIDVVVGGFSIPDVPYTTVPIGINPQNGTTVHWNGDYEFLNVLYNGVGKRIAVLVKAAETPDLMLFYIGPHGNDGEHLVFEKEAIGDNYVKLLVKYRSDVNKPATQLLATIMALGPTANGSGKIYRLEIGNDPTCYIDKLVPMSPLRPGSSNDSNNGSVEKSDHSEFSSHSIATPNPFSSAIRIQLPETKDPAGTTLHLYDLQGAKKLTYRVPADQPECTLNTSQLVPGVYFIRVESEGKVETIKVVKTM